MHLCVEVSSPVGGGGGGHEAERRQAEGVEQEGECLVLACLRKHRCFVWSSAHSVCNFELTCLIKLPLVKLSSH